MSDKSSTEVQVIYSICKVHHKFVVLVYHPCLYLYSFIMLKLKKRSIFSEAKAKGNELLFSLKNAWSCLIQRTGFT